jgi:hypothetical protein
MKPPRDLRGHDLAAAFALETRTMKIMAAKTVHVYRSDGAWAVKKEGKSAKIFSTQRDAVDAAKESVRCERAGQFVVHGINGQIREYETHGMTRIQDPPKKSRMAGRIGRAVGKVALERVQADPSPPSEHSAKK